MKILTFVCEETVAVLLTGRLFAFGPAVIGVSLPLFAHNLTLWYDMGCENTLVLIDFSQFVCYTIYASALH